MSNCSGVQVGSANGTLHEHSPEFALAERQRSLGHFNLVGVFLFLFIFLLLLLIRIRIERARHFSRKLEASQILAISLNIH